jgi:hypothetical protein
MYGMPRDRSPAVCWPRRVLGGREENGIIMALPFEV